MTFPASKVKPKPSRADKGFYPPLEAGCGESKVASRRVLITDMNLFRRSAMAITVVGALLPQAAAAQVPGNPAPRNGARAELSAEEIVDRAIERSDRQVSAGIDAEFEAYVLSVIDSVDGDGEVEDSESTRSHRYSILGAFFDELIEVDGEPLTEKERRKERERRDEFEREVAERIADGLSPQPEDDRRVEFNSYLMERYDLAVIGEERVRDHLCWVISMRPKPGKLPERTRMDKALNQANGRLWVAQRVLLDVGFLSIG